MFLSILDQDLTEQRNKNFVHYGIVSTTLVYIFWFKLEVLGYEKVFPVFRLKAQNILLRCIKLC